MARLPDRGHADSMLYSTMRAVYHFERTLYARFGLGYQEICLLQLLRRKSGLRIGDAARALEIPLFTATRLVQRLEAEALVTKRQDATDGRVVLINLAAKGRRLIRKVEDENYDLIMKNAETLSSEELKALVLLATRINELLGVAQSAAEGLDRT